MHVETIWLCVSWVALIGQGWTCSQRQHCRACGQVGQLDDVVSFIIWVLDIDDDDEDDDDDDNDNDGDGDDDDDDYDNEDDIDDDGYYK